MKKMYIAVLAVFAAALFGVGYHAYAADYGTSGSSDTSMSGSSMGNYKTLEGYIVDTKCTTSEAAKEAEKAGNIDAFMQEHSKGCALACRMGGCGFYAAGRLWKLDSASNDRIEAFLKQPDSTPHVTADVYNAGKDKIGLTNIQNVK